MIRRLWVIVLHGETRAVEVLLGLYSVVYGAWFLGPASLENSAAYSLIRPLISEEVFGALFVALGLLALIGVGLDNVGLRRLSSGLNLFSWTFLVILIGLSTNWTAGGLAHFVLAALANAWLNARQQGPS